MQLKAQTRTHPSGSQSGRSAAIPLRSRSQTTLPRHPLPRSAQHLRALGPPAPAPTPARAAPARWLPRAGSRALLPRVGSPAPARWALPRWLARSPRSGLRARAAAREGGADLGLDFSGEWNREQRGIRALGEQPEKRREDRGRIKESFYNQLDVSQLHFNGKTNSSGT